MSSLNLSDPQPIDSFDDLAREIVELTEETLPKYAAMEGNVHGDLYVEGRLLDGEEKINLLVNWHNEVRAIAERTDYLARIAPTSALTASAWSGRQHLIRICIDMQVAIEKLGGNPNELVTICGG